MHRNVFPVRDTFADDYLLSEDVRKMTLRSFLVGAGRKETRTDLHRLAFWGPTCVVFLAAFFYAFLWLVDDEQQIIQLEPHASSYHY
jgi:hypothetical protein